MRRQALIALASVLLFGVFWAWPAFHQQQRTTPGRPVRRPTGFGRTRWGPVHGTAPRRVGISVGTDSAESDRSIGWQPPRDRIARHGAGQHYDVDRGQGPLVLSAKGIRPIAGYGS